MRAAVSDLRVRLSRRCEQHWRASALAGDLANARRWRSTANALRSGEAPIRRLLLTAMLAFLIGALCGGSVAHASTPAWVRYTAFAIAGYFGARMGASL